MGYGETPDDHCLVIDVPVDTFSQIAPAESDMQYLAHIRDVTSSGGGQPAADRQSAVVVGNRIPQLGIPCRAILVSLENMADYLPAEDGTPSAKIPEGTDHVRLLAYTSWTYTANDLEQNLLNLLENLDTSPPAHPDTVRLPIVGNAPAAARVKQAAANQAAAAKGTGTLSPDDATVIVQNALAMGYVPTRPPPPPRQQRGLLVSRPLAPYPVAPTITVPVGGPDAATRYDPQAGLFDVSYGAAWSLGHSRATNSGISTAIYNWRQTVRRDQAAAAEQQLLLELVRRRAGPREPAGHPAGPAVRRRAQPSPRT